MPTRQLIEKEINKSVRVGPDFDKIRRKYLRLLADFTKRDTIIYASGFLSKTAQGIPNTFILITHVDVQGFMTALQGMKGDKLDLILHSPGGSLDAAEQIIFYLRERYRHIRAIVPQNAMSAATMIACACDEILMGKHSAIGPIDPQMTFPTKSGLFTAPAQAILDEFDLAKSEVIQNPKTAPLWVEKVRNLPPGLLTMCQDTILLSIFKVREWLTKYMFSGDTDGAIKAEQIAEWLGNAKEHRSHGRPINYKLAQEKGLRVSLIEEDQKLQEGVLSVYHATNITLENTNCVKFVENHQGKGWFYKVKVN